MGVRLEELMEGSMAASVVEQGDASSDSRSRLLELPREIRDMIYIILAEALPPVVPKHFSSSNFTLEKRDTPTRDPTPCGFLFVNKQIHVESKPVFEQHARILFRLTKRKVCGDIHIATSAAVAPPEVKRGLTALLVELIARHRNFVLKLHSFDGGAYIQDAKVPPAQKWTRALPAFLTWAYGTRPATAKHRKNITIFLTEGFMTALTAVGLELLPSILTEHMAVAAGSLVVDSQILTMEIFDPRYRRKILQAFNSLKKCKDAGARVTVRQI